MTKIKQKTNDKLIHPRAYPCAYSWAYPWACPCEYPWVCILEVNQRVIRIILWNITIPTLKLTISQKSFVFMQAYAKEHGRDLYLCVVARELHH